jgi:HPt (histidine-containing phosphotransfer) domain-containing protein
VLDFSKIEAGKMELEENVFCVADIVDSAVRICAEKAEQKQIELACNVGDSVPEELIADPNRLRQVLVNLVGNALKFTDSGEVIVKCDRQDTSREGTILRFEVHDSGCGIGKGAAGPDFRRLLPGRQLHDPDLWGTGLALTAHAAKSDRDRCLEAGMDDYLTKPLDAKELAKTLQKWLKGSGRSRRPETRPKGPVETGGGQPVVIDYPSLLERCMGKRELAERLVQMFLEHARDDLRELESALRKNNAAEIAATAHRVKGAAGTVSAMTMWEVSARLEVMGREKNLAGASDLVRQLGDCLELLRESVDAG